MAPRRKTQDTTRRATQRIRQWTQHSAAHAYRAGARQLLHQPQWPRPGHLYDLVMREVEEPLFRAVLGYAEGNQSRAADILGINRGTLRKKLKNYGISG